MTNFGGRRIKWTLVERNPEANRKGSGGGGLTGKGLLGRVKRFARNRVEKEGLVGSGDR